MDKNNLIIKYQGASIRTGLKSLIRNVESKPKRSGNEIDVFDK